MARGVAEGNSDECGMMWQNNEEPGDAHQRAAIGAWGVRFGLSMRVAYDLQVADSESVAAQSIQFVRGDVSMAGSIVGLVRGISGSRFCGERVQRDRVVLPDGNGGGRSMMRQTPSCSG